MKVIAFCGSFSSSTLVNAAIKIGTNNKVLIIEGRRMLFARYTDSPPETYGGLRKYLEHCFCLPQKEPSILPYIESTNTVHILSATDCVDFDWDGFYNRHHGYSFLEHLHNQFENLVYDYILIDVGPPTKDKNGFFLMATYQFSDTVVWTDQSEEFADFQFTLTLAEKEKFPTRIKNVVTDIEYLLD